MDGGVYFTSGDTLFVCVLSHKTKLNNFSSLTYVYVCLLTRHSFITSLYNLGKLLEPLVDSLMLIK